jgi:hypothetical protein
MVEFLILVRHDWDRDPYSPMSKPCTGAYQKGGDASPWYVDLETKTEWKNHLAECGPVTIEHQKDGVHLQMILDK